VSVICILIPRFELLAAVGERGKLLRTPLALAPEPDREQVVGEVSGAAEAHGVHPGMRLGEALARCPDLRLIAADPDRAANAWEEVIGALERIGAAVESERPGEAYFEAGGLVRLHGGIEGVIAAARRAVAMPARIGAGPSRFCAFAAASRARPGRGARIVPAGAARAFLAPLPVSLLRSRLPSPPVQSADVPAVLERLGIRTLGALAALDAADASDRFGHPGAYAHGLAHGRDTRLDPRSAREGLTERLDLLEAFSGLQLERMLELLIDRLLARRERRGRALRKLRLGARFVERGTWRREVTMREASSSRERIRIVLAPKLAELPAPIDQLSLAAVSFGPPAGDQLALRAPDGSERRRRLQEALRQTRAAAGADSLLRVLEIDPGSRVPERRAVLTPFPE
jgi:nucleotidyltransferase/DNA polymerase involved in DNA repair